MQPDHPEDVKRAAASGPQTASQDKAATTSSEPGSKRRRLPDKGPQRRDRGVYGQGGRDRDERSRQRVEAPENAKERPRENEDEASDRIRDNSRSPPRKRKLPTGAGRLTARDQDEAKRRQQERQQRLQEQGPQGELSGDVSNFVTQHYNAVPERDRKWRQTDSKIKGLRSFNNWVKACLIRKYVPTYPGVSVLDIGCGKGGDLQKWATQRVFNYVGLDAADISIGQAKERYQGMQKRFRNFHAELYVHDCFGKSVNEIPRVRQIGFNPNPDDRWGGGGFDVVSMMFCMHYAFESEQKARIMLQNAAGALKKGGHFVGVIPNSDVIAAKIKQYFQTEDAKDGNGIASRTSPPADDDDDWDPEKSVDDQEKEKKIAVGGITEDGETLKDSAETVEWGNDVYRVKFPGHPPRDGVFRPPYGWKYFYFLEEAVDTVPEYVVPWGVFRALAEDYNFSLSYMEPFAAVWESEKRNRESEQLAERMGVIRNGVLNISDDEHEATNFYLAFAFEKI